MGNQMDQFGSCGAHQISDPITFVSRNLRSCGTHQRENSIHSLLSHQISDPDYARFLVVVKIVPPKACPLGVVTIVPHMIKIQDLGLSDFMATGQIKSDVDLNEDSFHGDWSIPHTFIAIRGVKKLPWHTYYNTECSEKWLGAIKNTSRGF